MSKRADKRWEVLKKFFLKMKSLHETEGNKLYHKGALLKSKCTLVIDEEARAFKLLEVYSDYTFFMYDERGVNSDKISAEEIIGKLKKEFELYKRVSI